MTFYYTKYTLLTKDGNVINKEGSVGSTNRASMEICLRNGKSIYSDNYKVLSAEIITKEI